MTKTYPQTALVNPNPLSENWALATVRLITRDVPGESGAYPMDGFSDEDWMGWLKLTKVDAYFRPHRAALRALESNPRWLESESQEGYSSKRRLLELVLAGIARFSVDLEALLPLEFREVILLAQRKQQGSRSRRFVRTF